MGVLPYFYAADKVDSQTLYLNILNLTNLFVIVKNHKKRSNFLAVHPMAGTEFSGPSAAQKGLYIGKTNIVCEYEKTNKKLGEIALDVFEKLGMKIIYMDPKSHDTHVAYVSHLSHISSFMLGKTVIEKEKNENNIFDLAGSGFESSVRLAKSSPDTWTPIFLQNKINLAAAIDEYIINLNLLKELIVEENDKELNKILNNNNFETFFYLHHHGIIQMGGNTKDFG